MDAMQTHPRIAAVVLARSQCFSHAALDHAGGPQAGWCVRIGRLLGCLTRMTGPLAVLILVLLATLGVTVAQRVPAPVRKEFAPPPLDLKTQTLLYASSSFLYTGRDAVQIGVVPGTIEERRVAVVRGRVVNRLGKGMEKVLVRIDQHPEYGSTESRGDGWFDMAVNGGGQLIVSYEKAGFVPVQRSARPVWQETEVLDDVVLTALDPVVTQVNLAQTTQPIVVAAGSPQRDADGLRTARLAFASGTQANLRMPNGTTQPITSLDVRATELTVGDAGLAAMPAELPGTSAYTYAVEFSVDQALATGATGVEFSQPVISYVDNFLGFPAGTVVPSGRYDRERQAWIPSANGLVIRILSTTGGLANIDIAGSGQAATVAQLTALGITANERATLASTYQAGAGIWRVPVTHFSAYDFNWGIGLPNDASGVDGEGEDDQDDADGDSSECGSDIGVDAQTLGEEVAIVGTPFRLRYQSDRMPGADFRYSTTFRLTGSSISPSLLGVGVKFTVAGQTRRQYFAPAANLRTTFRWDGLDGYGRPVQGQQRCEVTIAYIYQAVYRPTPGFSLTTSSSSSSPITLGLGRMPVIQWAALGGPRLAAAGRLLSEVSWAQIPSTATREAKFEVSIGGWNARASAARLGGWTLSDHHAYQPGSRRLELGNGESRSQGPLDTQKVDTIPATLAATSSCRSMVVSPQGEVYYTSGNAVLKIASHGAVIVVAGGGSPPDLLGDGLPATQARLWGPQGICIAADGTIYIADTGSHRIRHIGTDGIIRTVAGNTTPWEGFSGTWLGIFGGDGGQASLARLNFPTGIAVAGDGSILFCDRSNRRVRKIEPSGVIRTIAGTGASTINVPTPPGLATSAGLSQTLAIALCPEGGFFCSNDRMVFRVDDAGLIRIVGGTTTLGYGGDGGPALQAQLSGVEGLLALESGDLLVADKSNHRVRLITKASTIDAVGPINTILGTGSTCNASSGCGDGGSPYLAQVTQPTCAAAGPDGTVYVGESAGRIRRISANLPGLAFADMLLPSKDGSEVYVFDAGGRHLRTVHGLTGATKLTFGYGAHGYLETVTDAFNNTTTIQRGVDGEAVAIVGPYGQSTGLSQVGGYLARITDPAGGEWNMAYDAGGLLQGFANPNGGVSTFEFVAGRLTRDTDPAGGFKTLARTTSRVSGGGFGVIKRTDVTVTTGMGRTSTYRREIATGQFGGGAVPPGVLRRTNTSSTGSREITDIYPTGRVVQTKPDGTKITTEVQSGPRWGLVAPVTTFREVRTPAGLVETTVAPVPVVTLATSSDPFSVLSITSSEVVNGRSTTTAYVYNPGANTRTVTVTSPAGRVRVQTFDDQGRLLTDRFGNLATTTYGYDLRGRLATISRSDGVTTRLVTLTYSAQGFLATVVDPLGRTTSYQYDAAGRKTVETLPDGNQVHMAYDASGNNTSLTPPGGLPHVFGYSEVDRVTSYVPPSVGAGAWATAHEYSGDQQLTRTTRPGGDTVDYAYNTSGLVSNVLHAGGSLAFTYDLLSSCCMNSGRVASIARQDTGQAQANGMAFTYDGPLMTGMVATGAQPGAVSWTYNNDLLRASESVNGASTILYSYDADRLMIGAGAETLARHAQNGLVAGTSIGAFTSTRSYNGFGELTSLSYSWNANSLASFSYVRDVLGRISSATETVQGVTTVLDYSYDLRGRLVQVHENSALRASYTYDGNGNRLSRADTIGTVYATYDAQDRMLAYGTESFTYTRAGELEAAVENGQTTAYAYDALGALRSVTQASTATISYVHTNQCLSVAKLRNGIVVRRLLYGDVLRPIAECDAQGSIQSRFVWDKQGVAPLHIVQSGQVFAVAADALGSPRLIIDVATGAVAQSITYDEFGNVSNDSAPGMQPFGFAGGIYDQDTKLCRFGWRDYDARIGRWMSKDPLLFGGGSSNVYEYCGGNPTNVVDPTGLDPTFGCTVSCSVTGPFGSHANIRFRQDGKVTAGVGVGAGNGCNIRCGPKDGTGEESGVSVSCQYNMGAGQFTASGRVWWSPTSGDYGRSGGFGQRGGTGFGPSGSCTANYTFNPQMPPPPPACRYEKVMP